MTEVATEVVDRLLVIVTEKTVPRAYFCGVTRDADGSLILRAAVAVGDLTELGELRELEGRMPFGILGKGQTSETSFVEVVDSTDNDETYTVSRLEGFGTLDYRFPELPDTSKTLRVFAPGSQAYSVWVTAPSDNDRLTAVAIDALRLMASAQHGCMLISGPDEGSMQAWMLEPAPLTTCIFPEEAAS